MDKLSDFKPLKRLVLPDLGELRCAGLVVIVGPNSSGKTQLLRDIKERISGEPRELVVASELEIETPDHDRFMKCLRDEGYVYSTWSNNDEEQLIPTTTFVGSGQGAQNVGLTQLNQWRGKASRAAERKQRNEYFAWVSKFLVTVLFLENRLTSLTTVQTIDFEKQPPKHDLHALHLNEAARDALTAEVQRAFSKSIWSCSARGSQLCLRISEDGLIPDHKARLSVHEMAKYRTIESEGDGMKSYVTTVISLLLGRRPITVIDEPELCLHPPQAYNLGQFIGRSGTSHQTATFVATHSSQILRGIVQTAESLQIVRLTRLGAGFSARLVSSDILAEAMKKPTVRAETVLDGIFAQAVTIIEGDGDRIVYQAAWEVIGQHQNFDIHFATAGGTGAIADTCQLYRILGIPVAVVADLDVLTDGDKMQRILEQLSDDPAAVLQVMQEVRAVAEEIRALPPTIDEAAARATLSELADREYDWAKGDDDSLRRELSALRGALNGMRKLKAGGVSELPAELSRRVASLVAELTTHGLFLVPVGELEEWLGHCGIVASKRTKWAWANEAADYIRSNPPREDDIWAFVEGVADHLTALFR